MNSQRNIVNIINFIRAVEPRNKDADLFRPVVEQMYLAGKYSFPVTWLIQYDAMIDKRYVDFLKRNMPPEHEVGIWFEVVQPLVEKAGLQWRGCFSWDWHVNVGFSIGYSPNERERLVDAFMGKFKEIWGYYPKSAGSWFIDAHTLAYMQEKYHIIASCNCREQFGTDGYSIWGGYWSGAYYPSRKNSLLPAQTANGQIPVPVFRMLGGDPIYQYASELKPEKFYDGYGGVGRTQDIITLEPVENHPDCGGADSDWIRWFLQNNFAEPYISLAYAQVGQENSMGWNAMKNGLTEQFRQLKALCRKDAITIETLADSGRRFKCEFDLSPTTAISALEDWKNEGRAAIWYMSRFQRLGFIVDDGRLFLRDWQLYNENYPEPFLKKACTETSCLYDALPIMDGFRWQHSVPAHGSLHKPYRPIKVTPSIGFRLEGKRGRIEKVVEGNGKSLEINWLTTDKLVQVVCSEDGLCFYFTGDGHALKMICDDTESEGTKIEFYPTGVRYHHTGLYYALKVESGYIETAERMFYPKDNVLKLKACVVEK